MSQDMSQVAASSTTAPQDKRPQVEALLADVFRLMEYPAKLDFKDMPDGSLGVAVHFEGELPGITAGKRSALLDSVQFWLNKVVNRPNVPRRWVNLGIDAFPEPRQPAQPAPPREAREPRQPGQPREPREARAPREQPVAAPAAPAQPKRAGQKAPGASAPVAAAAAVVQRSSGGRGRELDERGLTPPVDPTLTALGTLLAEKSAKHGRLYGVMLLTPEARATMLKAADAVKGVTGKAEGEGHWRRLVMVPEKLTVISKKQVMPDYDDEEEDE